MSATDDARTNKRVAEYDATIENWLLREEQAAAAVREHRAARERYLDAQSGQPWLF